MKCCQDIKVSIIMPSLNVAPYIRECIESAVNQSLVDIEIICIDAGSTDGTREIIAEYAKKDSRIMCIDSQIKSYGHQVNIGINAARGKYIAILETDDYVDTTMYEKLYTIASANNLDYVKADYDSFIEYNSSRLFKHIQIFNDDNKYNRVIDGRQLPEVFLTDQNIWRGIYKRDFLDKSDIRLNESPGAAYQDIGFVLLVMTYAERAMYINDSFYRYRMQREGGSSCSDKILQFSYQEFVRLIDELHIDNTDTFKYIVQRMAGVFLVEYTKLLTKCSFSFCKDYYKTYIEKYYTWFKDRLSEYIVTGCITEDDMTAADWGEINL
ncbi:MAG: glycosyltransferase, partial [Lachnospira sp.]|nr:glycosyltransferase [Lachnospira sp.]